MSRRNALSVIDRTIEGRRISQKISIFTIQMTHLLDNVDSFRGIQHLKKDAGAFKTEIHEREIDIVIAADSGLERIALTLLALQTGAHLRQLLARAHTLPVAAPIDVLQLMQKF